MGIPDFLRSQEEAARNALPDSLQAAIVQFEQINKVLNDRSYALDTDSMIRLLSSELRLVFGVLIEALRGRDI